jgi:two-component system, chemotaxis family, CheB/CheR fusion protein
MPEPGAHASADAVAHAPSRGAADGVRVVGIGASAGGLDAFTRLLEQLPSDTGFAYVLIQHLDATHASSLSEILGRATRMPVSEARHAMPVRPDQVYVIPPNTELTIVDRFLRLAPRVPGLAHMPVDRFLLSLAEDIGSQGVGVVLSGNGSDGTIGLIAVRDAGGMAFAQDPASAEFPSMPSTAASAGGTDLVLSPEAIGAELARMSRQPQSAHAAPAASGAAPMVIEEGDQLRTICDTMHEATGIDFSLYRETTVLRRILRRMALRGAADVAAYARLLAGDAAEQVALQRDLLIGVTSFFRDPDSFAALKTVVFPVIIRDRPAGSTIRIWVPGCASGEEAYSILMTLDEFQVESGTEFPVQLFASDISESAITKARLGKYPASIAAAVGPERLQQYFTLVDGGYQIAKALRERCVLSRHNLLDDPPFSRLDLISCRNVLIYLDAVQRHIVPLFHYALLEHGFLMLGRSETAHHANLFSLVEPRHKIYAKRSVARKPYRSFARIHGAYRAAAGTVSSEIAAPAHGAADLSRDADRVLLSKYRPAGVLVDAGLEVLEIRGDTAPFLALMPGRASYHLLKLVPDTSLYLAIEQLTQRAAVTGEPARAERVSYQTDGGVGVLNIEVMPLKSRERRGYLILFETLPRGGDSGPATTPPTGRGNPEDRDDLVARLNRQLLDARARLLTLVDEHETSDQENQQITEDALSANEELQSLTEELGTAKEELQSTNEELLTVNRELESRNVALASARDLAKSMIETVGIPLLVIDDALVVRHVNAAFARVFAVQPPAADGRHLLDLSGGAWDIADLRVRLDALVREHRSFTDLEIACTFEGIGARVVRLGGQRLEPLELILLTVEDVTRQRAAEQALRKSEERRRESEKMETVGRLAGGIAHDFNNLLTVILGYADLLGLTLGRSHDALDEVEQIRRSAKRAAALTDQLLAFSRRKVLQPRGFDLNPLVVEFERMLRRLLEEQITIVVRSATEPCLVWADSAEIGRVVMNLCLNARDAMPAGGTLTIETDHVRFTETDVAPEGLTSGRYVRLVVSDTGLGMDAETRRHAFEPFFTTKPVGQSAGLGLATVFGILQQSGGSVSCKSGLGEGTTFTVLLPVAAGTEEGVEHGAGVMQLAPPGSLEVVLLVEDEEGVRVLTKRILERAGYVVHGAKDGLDGLAVLKSHAGRIDLLLTDVMMPGLRGRALAEQALALRPDLKVLFVSGHTEDVILKEGVAHGMPFLRKPFAPADLTRSVRAVLNATDGASFVDRGAAAGGTADPAAAE